MFNFTITQQGDKTTAVLGEYSVRFFANSRNTRITATVGNADSDDSEGRASGSLFYHYDAVAQGHSHVDVGSKTYDNTVSV